MYYYIIIINVIYYYFAPVSTKPQANKLNNYGWIWLSLRFERARIRETLFACWMVMERRYYYQLNSNLLEMATRKLNIKITVIKIKLK